MSDVDTVWTWGEQTSTPRISKYLIKKGGRYGIRTRYHRAIVARVNSCTTSGYDREYMEYCYIYDKKK